MRNIPSLEQSKNVRIVDSKAELVESEYRFLSIHGMSDVADVTNHKCDTIEVVRFLYASATFDHMCIDERFDEVVVLGDDFYIDELGTSILLPEIDQSPRVLICPTKSECSGENLVLKRAYIYYYRMQDILVVPASYQVIRQMNSEYLTDDSIPNVYASAVAGGSDNDMSESDPQVVIGIACDHCDISDLDDSGICSSMDASLVEDLSNVDLSGLGELLISALKSLELKQPNLQATVSLLIEVKQYLGLFSKDSELLQSTLDSIDSDIREIWFDSDPL